MPNYLIGLTDHQMERLRDISVCSHMPVSHLIRRGVDMVINNQTPFNINMSGNLVSGHVLVVMVN